MAIYHFSVKNISRAQGRSAVACAAYRSGEKLIDERQGKEQDYTKKTGVELTRIYAPIGTNAELLDRGQLWNAVEKTERRKDANLAREFEIALPQELNKAEREKLVDELCNKIVERHNVIVDAAIHAPHTDSGSDERNYHAHIMFTGRHIDLETGDFAAKKNRDFNKENSSETVQKWREDFADMTNAHLMRAGHLFSSVDHRSYAAQGLDKEATAHEGSAVTKLRRLGIDTEISLSNDAIKQRNAERHNLPKLIDGLEQEIIASERIIAKLEQQQAEQRTAAAPRAELDQLEQNYDAIKQRNSELEGQIKQLEANEPPAKKYGMFGNKDHTDWAQRLATLQTELEQGQRKQADALRTVINHPIYKQELSDHINKSEHRKKASAAAPQKQTIEQVYQQLNSEQKRAYNDLKALIQQRCSGQQLNEKMAQLDAKFIEKFNENPRFEVPKAPEVAQEQVRTASRSSSSDRGR
jgi:hypothetical protein